MNGYKSMSYKALNLTYNVLSDVGSLIKDIVRLRPVRVIVLQGIVTSHIPCFQGGGNDYYALEL